MRRVSIALVIALMLASAALSEGAGSRAAIHAATPGDPPLPMDALTRICYIPIDDATRFPMPLAGGWQAASPDADGGVGECVVQADNGRSPPIGAVLTRLPVMCIDTETGGLPDEDDMRGTLRIYEADGSGGVRLTSTSIEINLRGNTSKRFPKKSYRVRTVDGAGDKRNLSIAGLRSDDDWILNPMYSDTSKIREALSYWLWDEINSCGQAAASSGVAYAEVLINGDYYGLYGVQERVDRKQVNADRNTGILYKVTANDRPTPEELTQCESDEACRGIELAFAGQYVTEPWGPAADYMALLEGEAAPGGAVLSGDNAVDYTLWAVLVQARDGHFKNQFIHCTLNATGYTLYHIPWDLNHTLGDLWSGDDADANYLEYDITRLALDDAAEVLLASPDAALIDNMKARWSALRAGAITQTNILSRAHALFDSLYPAIERDTQRWPACGMGEGNATNIRDIEDYIRVMLPRMDGWIASLKAEE